MSTEDSLSQRLNVPFPQDAAAKQGKINVTGLNKRLATEKNPILNCLYDKTNQV